MRVGDDQTAPAFAQIALEFGRIGCVGFGGPPAHVALLRELCVQRRGWLTSAQFEHALAAANLLPGPASTQLAIYCAWRLRGARGALLGGLCFILPGLAAILGLSALFLSGSPPTWLRGAGLGAGAAVAAVAVRAGAGVAGPIWLSAEGSRRVRVAGYALVGALAGALAGAGLVLVLLACGAVELIRLGLDRRTPGVGAWLAPAAMRLSLGRSRPLARPLSPLFALAGAAEPGGTVALAWTALKVGALAFGGGFVIVPLMQGDAVDTYHWMSHSQFLNAVALGQVTPGPLTQTVAAVGYAAGGLRDGLLAAAIAFAPSFCFVLFGASHFERLSSNAHMRAFLAGAAPAAAGAIVGSAIPLARTLGESWEYVVLAGAAILLLARRGIVTTLLLAGCAGTAAVLLGAPIPR
jgi:chromate transporter